MGQYPKIILTMMFKLQIHSGSIKGKKINPLADDENRGCNLYIQTLNFLIDFNGLDT